MDAAETLPPQIADAAYNTLRRKSWLRKIGNVIAALTPPNTFRGKLRVLAQEAIKDHDLWVRSSAIGGGVAVVTEGMVGIYILLTMPVVVAVAGIIACGALMGLGLYGIYAGATGLVSSIKKVYTKAFHRERVKDEEEEETPGKSLRQRLWEHPRFKRVAENPLVQKLSNGPVGKIMRRVGTQRQKDILMAGLTLKGSLVVVAISAFIIASHALALSVVTLGTLLSAPVIAAAGWGLGGLIDTYRGAKVLIRSLRNKKAVKKEIAVLPEAKSTVAEPAPAALTSLSATPAFTEAASPAAPAETPALPPVKTRVSPAKAKKTPKAA